MPVGLIVAMNITEGYLERAGYSAKFKNYAALFERFLGPVKTLYCTETLQTADYGKYELSMFDEAARKKRHADIFPLDLKKAAELGASLVGLCTSGKS
jgi:hypothetical protein